MKQTFSKLKEKNEERVAAVIVRTRADPSGPRALDHVYYYNHVVVRLLLLPVIKH